MENQKEIWKPIENFKNYEISSLGNVKSFGRLIIDNNGVKRFYKEKILKPRYSKGYLMVALYANKTRKDIFIHVLVAQAFLGHTPCGHKLVVNHKDNDNPNNKQDNRVENLEIITQRKNANLQHIPHSSKYTGVSWSKIAKKWESYIKINGKKKHLGHFTNELDAHNAYQNALKNLNN